MENGKEQNFFLQEATAGPHGKGPLSQEDAPLNKNQLIDNLAYQIRTLSNAIIGFSNLLAAEDLTDTQQEYITEIDHAGQGLSSIVNDVLDLARIASGNLKPEHIRVDLAEVLKEIEATLAQAAHQKGLDFSMLPSAGLPGWIQTDPDRLRRCLLNVAGNAIQYTRQGYVNILVGAESGSPQPLIRFDIVDTGVGIPPDQLKTIFEPTEQAEKVNAGMLTSIGLGVNGCGGLLITRHLVNLLGGRMEITSQPEVGSTFSLIFPMHVDVPSEAPLVYPPSGEPKEPNTFCVGNILVVEDEESNRTVLSLLLENIGMEATAAACGQEALQRTQQETFDVILMDIQLPDIDGFEVVRQLRRQGIATPVIALSAGVMDDSDQRQITELFEAFLAKPVDRQQLAETLEPYLPTLQEQAELSSCNEWENK